MTVDDLLLRFPEIPRDLGTDPLLGELVEKCGPLFEIAVKPSPCSTRQDAANHYYLKLVGPMAVYGYGLASRDKVLGQIRELIERRDADPERFAASLLPHDAAPREVKGPGCS